MQKWGMAETYQGVISQIIPCIVSQLTVFILHFLLQNSTILADLSRMLMDSLQDGTRVGVRPYSHIFKNLLL